MSPLSLFTQIMAVTMALVISYFYILPTIEEIGTIQTDTVTYQTERQRIEDINNQLANKMASYQAVPRTDKERLATYMPRTVDDISIMRDITFIIAQAGVANTSLSYDGIDEGETVFSEDDESQTAQGYPQATPHAFTLEVEGAYAQIKSLLSLLEQNEYPLEVHELLITPNDTGVVSASMRLVTYADELVLVNRN